MARGILITGGSGLMGKLLTKKLQNSGYQVSIMSRNPDRVKHVKSFYWNVEKQEIDKNCLDGIHVIIHLAGENIAAARWTTKRKQEVIDSRTDSVALLYKLMSENPSSVNTIISASAVGYYGDRGEEILVEESASGTGFLAECCKRWETAVDKGNELGLRVVKFRIGLLLTRKEGVLEPFKKMANSFMAMNFGSGKQWFPWIHIDDLIEMFLWAIKEEQLNGVYNACSPSPVRNQEFIKELAQVLKKPFWPMRIPRIFFKILLGERSELLLMSTHTSVQKLQEKGYVFKYPLLRKALEDITSSIK